MDRGPVRAGLDTRGSFDSVSTEPSVVRALLAEVDGHHDLFAKIGLLLDQIGARIDGPEPLSQPIQQCIG